MISDQPRNMLLNVILQPLGWTSYVPTITLAHKLHRTYILKVAKIALSNTFLGQSETIIFLKIAPIFPVPARQTAPLKLLPMTLLLDSIFWKALHVPANTMMPNFLSLLEDVLFTFLLLKLLLSNLFNLIYVD